MSHVRQPAVAGRFYPADKAELERAVDALLGAIAVPAGEPPPKAVIAPHAGYVYSGPVAAAAHARLAALKGIVTRVVLLGPSHRVAFRGMAVGAAQAWETPLGRVPLDQEWIGRLKALPLTGTLEEAHSHEHSLEVHLPFLQRVLGDFTLVPVVVGDCPAESVADLLDAAWGGPETVIVISTDLSHYLDYQACREMDARTAAAITALDPAGLGRDQACGRVPVAGMLVAARRRTLSIAQLDLRNSGDTAGPRDRVVGYGAWTLTERPPSPEEAALRALAPTLLDLARAAIAAGLDGKSLTFQATGRLAEPGAAFVTLKRGGRLRGCIGSVLAWRGLAEDVADNARKAAFADPRFPKLTRDEMEGLDLSVSVLTPPVPMDFADQADLLARLRPRMDGLIIEDQGRRALFLPAVWEQLPSPQDFLAHLKAKAGMPADHWSPSFKASRFQAIELH